MATVSIDNITENSKQVEPKDKFLHEHGYPENHNLPETISVERNGVTLEYYFTERDRLLKNGKGLPYWMPDLSHKDILVHLGDDIVFQALKDFMTPLMQELTNPAKYADLWSEDRTKIDDEMLSKLIAEYKVEREKLEPLNDRLTKIKDVELPAVMADLASGNMEKSSAAMEKQNKLIKEIGELYIKIANLKANRKSSK